MFSPGCGVVSLSFHCCVWSKPLIPGLQPIKTSRALKDKWFPFIISTFCNCPLNLNHKIGLEEFSNSDPKAPQKMIIDVMNLSVSFCPTWKFWVCSCFCVLISQRIKCGWFLSCVNMKPNGFLKQVLLNFQHVRYCTGMWFLLHTSEELPLLKLQHTVATVSSNVFCFDCFYFLHMIHAMFEL